MRNYIIFFLFFCLIFLFSCAVAYPPEEDNEYIPKIIYRVSSTTHSSCPLIRYRDENGDLISLTDETLPWEQQVVVDDDTPLTLHAEHLQTPVISGNATGGTDDFLLVDSAAPFGPIGDTYSYTVLHVLTRIAHQISVKESNSTLRLNIDTFEDTDSYEVYERMHYEVAIYRIDESGSEDPMIYTDRLYHSLDTTLETYAY
ncbi:MAG: hypothetical protein JXB88_26525 [Spirochaetales bacterium]|nr:hypothetical protein [Spirochaetales bacterium]